MTRVGEALNDALHALMAAEDGIVLLGEDLLDPYGGAFKISRGLSSRFGARVITTPLSENGFVGVGAGIALAGGKAIVEIMFGDFIALAFDPILNFASKAVTMYGDTVPMSLIVRCPIGAGRGYGPTHSQSLQKHFVGIPNLALFELSAFHDPLALYGAMLALRIPCIVFEDKALYAQPHVGCGKVDDLFVAELVRGRPDVARVFSPAFRRAQIVFVAAGGVAARCIAAARRLFLEHELESAVLVPSQLHPLPLDGLLEHLGGARQIVVVEDGTPGASWGDGLAARLYDALWGTLRAPIARVTSADAVIPSAMHLERDVIVNADRIYAAALASVQRSSERPA